MHLAGAPIAAKRWTDARKAVLRASRIESTRTLTMAMAAAMPPPRVLVCGSAIGFYGDTGGEVVDESGPAGTGFLPDLVRDWEIAAEPAAEAGVRVTFIRSGVVLAAEGGMLARLMLPFKLGLGARIGAGTQYLSWISLTDEVRAIRFVLDQHDLAGPVNLTAPEPVTNAEFTQALAKVLRRPSLFALPSPVLSATLGELASELLASARVVPARLRQAGFTFRNPDISAALTTIVAAQRAG